MSYCAYSTDADCSIKCFTVTRRSIYYCSVSQYQLVSFSRLTYQFTRSNNRNNCYMYIETLYQINHETFLHCIEKGFQVWRVPSNGRLLVAAHCTPRKVGVLVGQAYCEQLKSLNTLTIIHNHSHEYYMFHIAQTFHHNIYLQIEAYKIYMHYRSEPLNKCFAI